MDFEKIAFDFNKESALASAERLESILSSDHWSDHGLDYSNLWTRLLFQLLQIGGIAIYQHRYTPVEETPKLRRSADTLNIWLCKRTVDQTLLYMADFFSKNELEPQKGIYNAPFFPALRVYARYGELPPERVFDFLVEKDCDGILLFHPTYSNDDPVFHAITRVMPKELLIGEIEKVRVEIVDILRKKTEEFRGNSVFPKLPDENG